MALDNPASALSGAGSPEPGAGHESLPARGGCDKWRTVTMWGRERGQPGRRSRVGGLEIDGAVIVVHSTAHCTPPPH